MIKFKVRDVCNLIIGFLFLLIAFSAKTVLAYDRNIICILMTAVLLAIRLVYRQYMGMPTKVQYFLLGFSIWLMFGILWSPVRGLTQKNVLIFIIYMTLAFCSLTQDFYQNLLKVCRIVCLIYAVSSLICIIDHEFIIRYFSSWIIDRTSVLSEISKGVYSGLAGEKAECALLMNVGFGIAAADYFSRHVFSFKNLLEMSIYLMAIIVTGKRTLAIIPVVLFIVLIISSDIKNKYLKLISIITTAGLVFLVLVQLIPELGLLFKRLDLSSGDDVLTGRTKMWNNCITMLKDKPITGWGFKSFNTVFFQNVGFIYKGKPWQADAHNIYLQLLAETGIIGFTLFLGMNICIIKRFYRLIRKLKELNVEQKRLLYLSIYLVGLFLIYGLTGNIIYYFQQLIWYAFAISMLTFVIQDSEDKKNDRNTNLS